MSRSTNPMLFKTGTEPLPSSPRSHRLDESAAGYSLTGCSPALPVSASPTGLYRQAEDVHLSSNSNGTGDSPLDFGAAAGQTINYQGGPNQMIEVGQAGRSNSQDESRCFAIGGSSLKQHRTKVVALAGPRRGFSARSEGLIRHDVLNDDPWPWLAGRRSARNGRYTSANPVW